MKKFLLVLAFIAPLFVVYSCGKKPEEPKYQAPAPGGIWYPERAPAPPVIITPPAPPTATPAPAVKRKARKPRPKRPAVAYKAPAPTPQEPQEYAQTPPEAHVPCFFPIIPCKPANI